MVVLTYNMQKFVFKETACDFISNILIYLQKIRFNSQNKVCIFSNIKLLKHHNCIHLFIHFAKDDNALFTCGGIGSP